MRKPVFGIFDQVRLKPACSATEATERHEITNVETRGIILSRKGTTKVQTARMRRLICAFVVHIWQKQVFSWWGSLTRVRGVDLPLVPYIVWTNSEGSGKTVQMPRLAWAFAGHTCDKDHFLVHSHPLVSEIWLLLCFDLLFEWTVIALTRLRGCAGLPVFAVHLHDEAGQNVTETSDSGFQQSDLVMKGMKKVLFQEGDGITIEPCHKKTCLQGFATR